MAKIIDRTSKYAAKTVRVVARWFFRALWLACFLAVAFQILPRAAQLPYLRVAAHYILPPFGVISSNLPTKYYGYDFSPVIGAFVILVLSTVVHSVVDRWDLRVAQQQVRARPRTGKPGAEMEVEVAPADDQSQRYRLLDQVAKAKKALTQMQKNLAFLSVDVIGSTRMKIGEDKLLVEHAFVEYRRSVEKILTKHNVWKASWTPDGIMACFFEVQHAYDAGRELIEMLKWFNREVSQLKTPFSVRCGLNAGEVMFPATSVVEEVSDAVIDLAGHLQKAANPDSIWVTTTLVEQLGAKQDFHRVEQMVDGNAVFEWRTAEQSTTTAAS